MSIVDIDNKRAFCFQRNSSIHNLPANDGVSYLSFGRKHNQISSLSRRQQTSLIGDPKTLRGIQCCQLDCLLQLPSCKTHHVAYCAIQSQNAASQFALVLATSISYLDLQTTQTVDPVLHPRRTDRVRDEYGPVRAFCAQEQFQHARMDMNSVGDDVCGQLVILQNRAQNTRLAMIERAHGIEGVRGMIGAGGNARLCLLISSIRVPQTGMHTELASVANCV